MILAVTSFKPPPVADMREDALAPYTAWPPQGCGGENIQHTLGAKGTKIKQGELNCVFKA